MVRPIILALIIVLLNIGGSATTAQTSPTDDPSLDPRGWRVFSVIDGIEIPEEVLIQIQMDHQGYAATKASITHRNGQQHYSLRVDRNDDPSDYNSFYLLYDMNWQLVGRENTVAPPPPPPAPEAPKPDDGNNGRGNDNRGNDHEEEEDEDEEPPIEEPEPEPEPEVRRPRPPRSDD